MTDLPLQADSTETHTESRQGLLDDLTRFFGVRFAVWDRVGDAPTLPCGDLSLPLRDEWRRSLGAVDEGRPEVIECGGGLAALAVPLDASDVAFTACRVGDSFPDEFATSHGGHPAQLKQWWQTAPVWDASCLRRMADAVLAGAASRARVERLEEEIAAVSQNLVSTYEEISLLYTVTQNLRISHSDEEIARLALERMAECVPAEGFSIQYLADDGEPESEFTRPDQAKLIVQGDPPAADLTTLAEALQLTDKPRTCVINRRVTDEASWKFSQIRQLILVPLADGKKQFGWLAAINHREDDEFGTVEANLLSSLGALLGIHFSNRDLYQQQEEFLRNVVRALVSAIDAKDRYTSGHSDRVARFAVRLALELKCEPQIVNTIYLAGLLHDIGKIGIEDSVLRKPGRLTAEEFEHIKLHPELGYKILADLKQLSETLPAVLHHHEQWDGGGYPHGLAGLDIPKLARIMAVADAYDAMTSDRPYRAGMPDDKVDAIFREGSGQQWDPDVVEAYFSAKDDIMEIAQRERSDAELLAGEFV